MDRKEAWKLPDGSQLSYMALQEMGLTSGDIGEVMRQMYRDPDPEAMRNMALKGGALLGGRAEDKNDADFQQKMRENDERLNEEHRQEQQRTAEQHRQQEQQDQKSWQEKQDADAAYAAKNRPGADAENARIGWLPCGLAGFGLGLGLTGTALGAAGQAMSGSVSSMNSPMMVASNNGGGLLAMARGALGIDGPGNDKDIQLTGPNRTNVFTPGVTPEIAMSTPAFNPNSPNPFSQKPGMGMPGLTPPGMS